MLSAVSPARAVWTTRSSDSLPSTAPPSGRRGRSHAANAPPAAGAEEAAVGAEAPSGSAAALSGAGVGRTRASPCPWTFRPRGKQEPIRRSSHQTFETEGFNGSTRTALFRDSTVYAAVRDSGGVSAAPGTRTTRMCRIEWGGPLYAASSSLSSSASKAARARRRPRPELAQDSVGPVRSCFSRVATFLSRRPRLCSVSSSTGKTASLELTAHRGRARLLERAGSARRACRRAGSPTRRAGNPRTGSSGWGTDGSRARACARASAETNEP